MLSRITTWLWLREYETAEARAGHIAAGRHLRVAMTSLMLAALVGAGRLTGARP